MRTLPMFAIAVSMLAVCPPVLSKGAKAGNIKLN